MSKKERPFWQQVWVQVAAGVLVVAIVSTVGWLSPQARQVASVAAAGVWRLAFYEVAIWQLAVAAAVLLVARGLLFRHSWGEPTELQLRILGAFARYDEVWLDATEIQESIGVPQVSVRAAIDGMPQMVQQGYGAYGQLRVGLTELGRKIVAESFPEGMGEAREGRDELPY